jgi:glycosyltransferase involved in cell wall biosynthesis
MARTESNRRALLCGVGPIPLGSPDRLHAPGLRLWAFSRALLEKGCSVDLLEARFGEAISGGGAGVLRMRLTEKRDADGQREIAADSVGLEPAAPSILVSRRLAAQSYDAVISTTDVMNEACAVSCGDLPLWCDFFGHPMAERQALADVYGSDEGIAPQWDMVIAALLRGDRFSGCSEAQRCALIGELGACGRLNRFTSGESLVTSIPAAAVFRRFSPGGTAVRGKVVPEDAFVVLWTGGYNTWADPDTLAAALIRAMEREPRIHYLSTGGAIEGHDDRTFGRFRRQIDASPFAERCHFAGWVETRQVPDYYLQADVAVNCDRAVLEGELGTRTRMHEWICAGLPVISTNGCELARDLADRGLIDTFEAGDSQSLADRILEAAQRRPEETQRRTEEARRCLLEAYDPARLCRELADWAADPVRARDLSANGVRLPGIPFSFPDNGLARRRAAEWLAAREAGGPATGPGGPRLNPLSWPGLTRRARRILGRLRAWPCSRPRAVR